MIVRRRFQPASLACASVPVSIVVALAGHDPEGWFGSKLHASVLGVALMTGVSVLAAAGGLLHAMQVRQGRALAVTALAALAAISLRLSVTDPVVGLAALGWYAFVALRILRPDGARDDLESAGVTELAQTSETGLGVLAIVLTVLTFGYEMSSSLGVVVAVLVVAGGSMLVSAAAEAPEWTKGRWSFWLLAGWVTGLGVAALGRFSVAAIAAGIAVRQTVVLARRHLDRATIHAFLHYLFARPAQMFALSFGVIIASGAIVLSFPICSASGHGIPAIDALFTATSAVCVTGLATIDVSTVLSATGQLVLLTLIQLGGLGVITLSSFAAILLSSRLGLRHEAALGELVDQQRPNELARLVRFIVLSTVSIEALGALVLWGGFALHEPSRPRLAWVAIFHAISSFCNAGFALQSDNLTAYQSAPAVLLPIAVLIMLGGIGFPVMGACGALVLRSNRRIPVHARMALWVTLALIVGGTAALLVLEWDGAFRAQGPAGKLLSAFFQSVTLRTAGFNSVPMDSFRSASMFLMMLWMFIGGNAGSTAGGIKVTTVAVLLAQLRALLRGRETVEAFGRTIPHAIVQRAAAVTVLGASAIFCGHFLLLVSQPHSFESLLFEAISAAGTVGLSMDLTTRLDALGKMVIVALMFAGRVGPLTLLLTLREDRVARLSVPLENVPVG